MLMAGRDAVVLLRRDAHITRYYIEQKLLLMQRRPISEGGASIAFTCADGITNYAQPLRWPASTYCSIGIILSMTLHYACDMLLRMRRVTMMEQDVFLIARGQ